MIDEVGEAGIRLERILELTDASPSSLYHHFGNLRGLIEEAQIHRFITVVTQNFNDFETATQNITSRGEFCVVIEAMFAAFTNTKREAIRFARANALGSAFMREEFGERLAKAQLESIKTGAVLLDRLRVDKILRPDFDSEAFLAWFDGQFFGRILTEITHDSVLLRKWDSVAREAVYVALFGVDGIDLAKRSQS
jgi:AcrR family transcriptional regulator